MNSHFRDPIHGMIEVSDKELCIVNDPMFQRLRYIRQLGTSYLVYHGAEHTRFGHSLGVMHLVSKALDTLYEKGCLRLSKEEFHRIRQIARIVGLLHDVGHGPFSHVGETTGLYPEIEDFDKEKKAGHEVFSRLLILNHFGEIIDSLFKQEEITKADVLAFLAGWSIDKKFYFIKDLINGQLDADRMDYLLRDSYYCGVQYGKYDLHRILNTLCICYPDNNPHLEWQLGVESDGVHAVEEFIFARYWMFIQVYFHKTRRIYDYYMTRFIQDLLHEEYGHRHYPADLKEYMSWNDNRVLQSIEKQQGKAWASNIYLRKHLKEAFVSLPLPESNIEDELKDEPLKIGWVINQVEQTYSEAIEKGDVYIDQAKTSASKYLVDVNEYIEETQEDETNPLFAIPVLDKYTQKTRSLQDYSPHVKNISGKKINILRVYATPELKEKVCNFCNLKYYQGYDLYIEEVRTARKHYEELGKKLEQHELECRKIKDRFK